MHFRSEVKYRPECGLCSRPGVNMEPFEQAFRLKAKIQRERLHFVKSELALASTFLDFAKVTRW